MHTQIPLLKAYIPISIYKLLFFQLKMAKQMSFNGENSSTKAYTHIRFSSNIKWQYKRPLVDTIAQLKACTLPLLKASTHIHNKLLFFSQCKMAMQSSLVNTIAQLKAYTHTSTKGMHTH